MCGVVVAASLPRPSTPLRVTSFRPEIFGQLATAVLCLVGATTAQGDRSARITRIAEGQLIEVDGHLDEVAWQGVEPISPLTQVDPDEGAEPSRRTRVRIIYDQDAIYFAIECEEDPALVRARIMRRDAELDPDDRVSFWLDTFNDRRFAYWFQIGAAGGRSDGLLANGTFNKNWDGIWNARARVTDQGWQVEVVVPFKTLAFREDGSTWGFNFERERKENNEQSRWAWPFVSYRFQTTANGGTLTGIEDIRQGVGLDLVPYVKLSAERDRTVSKHTSRLGDAGLDLSYRITPALNFRLTYNTDFAETEVDQRRSNLTRFPLFFPEKRAFFLEDAGVFEFGTPNRRFTTLTPFFSRRIGRDDNGEAIPINVGGKLTGRAGDWNLGVLSVHQDEHVDSDLKSSDDRTLSVVRVSRNFGRESSAGIIATAGRPTDPGEALTTGVDFHIGDSRAFGDGKGYDIYGWWLGSQLAGPGGDGNAYGMRMEYDSKTWDFTWTERHVEEEFSPELGFVRRTGTRNHQLFVTHEWRSANGGPLRRWTFRIMPSLTTTEDGGKDSYRVPVKIGEFVTRSDDTFGYQISKLYERLPTSFDISSGVTVPPGDYSTTEHEFEIKTSKARAAFIELKTRFGSFYSGNLTRYEIKPTLIMGRYAQLSASYEQNHVILDEGRFTTRIWSGNLDFALSPDISWRNLVQYDSESKNLGGQSRIRWIYEPGQELFLVGLFGWQKADHSSPFLPTNQEVALKLLYTLRF